MGNMSYCRFTNTLKDLRDCVRAIETADDAGQFVEDLSEEERRSFERMVRECGQFSEDYAPFCRKSTEAKA